jgi:hypothetical protein
MLSHFQSIPFRASYSSSPAFQKARNTPAAAQRWKRSWAVEPGQNTVASSAFHWQPVRSTKKMASAQSRSLRGGRPPPKRWVFTRGGNNSCIFAHNSSGMRQRSGPAMVLIGGGFLRLVGDLEQPTRKWVIRIAS